MPATHRPERAVGVLKVGLRGWEPIRAQASFAARAFTHTSPAGPSTLYAGPGRCSPPCLSLMNGSGKKAWPGCSNSERAGARASCETCRDGVHAGSAAAAWSGTVRPA
jgi:hypothetical protein